MDTDEGLYHAIPQTRGKIAHQSIDTKKTSNRKDDLLSFPVFSEKYGNAIHRDVDIVYF